MTARDEVLAALPEFRARRALRAQAPVSPDESALDGGDRVNTGDLATWAGALATAAAGGFAGWQLLLLRRQQAEGRRAETAGVVVTWEQEIKPRVAEADGSATWVFEIAVHNPGHLPIRNVEIDMTFPREVQRLHDDGHIDAPTRTLNLGIAVLAAASVKEWSRTVRVPFDESESLRGIFATVAFVDMDGRTNVNRWEATPLER